MSAYGQEMEREYSAHSLSSREGSERGSQYDTEAGIFLSSFAATIFISGLVTFGISALSLLFALTVMLKSCESRNSGVVEMFKDAHSYDYCRNFALHAELNHLGADALHAACEDINLRYIKEGLYVRDLNTTFGIIEEFFASVRSQNESQDVVMMNADDLLASETSLVKMMPYRSNKDSAHNINRDASYLKFIFSVKLCKKLQSTRWQLILFSRRPEKWRNTTIEFLKSVGCHGWSSLIMRMDAEMQIEFQDFILRQGSMIQRKGYRIIAVISSQMDALVGLQLGDRIFKLPNPIFKYSMGEHDESKIQEE